MNQLTCRILMGMARTPMIRFLGPRDQLKQQQPETPVQPSKVQSKT